MKYEELYNKIINRFSWYDIEEESKEELKRAFEIQDNKYLLSVLNWFKIDYYETKENDDLEIINRLEDVLNLKIIKG